MFRFIKLTVVVLPAILVWQSVDAKTVTVQEQGQNKQEQTKQNQAQDGVEVQARGQVHEAFASPTVERQKPGPIVRKKPPEPVNELPPDQKPEGDNVQWIPGYWMWDEDRNDFLWVSGTWRNIPPEKRWLPGYWVDAEGGSRWVSGYWADQAETNVNLYPEPPAPIEEAVPALDDTNQTYVPGIWVYRDNRYWWRPGFRVNYHPGWLWIPSCYRWTPGGYVFIDGYWDYDLLRRGICFAPVVIDPRISIFRPSFVISTDFLLASLFVNTGWNHYYFGDYYEPRYAQRGFTPWITYRSSNRLYDPLFSYYRWEHRSDPRWVQNIQNVFTGRRDGSMPRPPRTLAQAGSTQQGANVNTVVSLDQWKSDQFKLQKLAPGEDKRSVEHFRTMRTERTKNETERRTSMYPPEKAAGKEGQVERREGTKDIPPTKQPPAKQEKPPVGGKDVPSKIDSGSQPSYRYSLPKSEQTYRPPTGDRAAPQRPAHPQPMQNPQGKGSDSPGKKG